MKNKTFNILFVIAFILICTLGILAVFNDVAREALAIVRDILINIFIIGLLLSIPKETKEETK
jgi:cytochrome c oxidase subunit IV